MKLNLKRIKDEYQHRNYLAKQGLSNSNTFLLIGDSGTGKTLTAEVMATELSLPFLIIKTSELINEEYVFGVFKCIDKFPGVYLFDSIHFIKDNADAFFAGIKKVNTNSIVFAETNKHKSLNNELSEGFESVIRYAIPFIDGIEELFKLKLTPLVEDGVLSNEVFCNELYSNALGLSYEDITLICDEATKKSLLEENAKIDKSFFTLRVKNAIKKKYAIDLF